MFPTRVLAGEHVTARATIRDASMSPSKRESAAQTSARILPSASASSQLPGGGHTIANVTAREQAAPPSYDGAAGSKPEYLEGAQPAALVEHSMLWGAGGVSRDRTVSLVFCNGLSFYLFCFVTHQGDESHTGGQCHAASGE